MTPEQLRLLRQLALSQRQATNAVMSGELDHTGSLDEATATLVRLAALLSVDSDPSTFQWAVEQGIAAGVDDGDIFDTLVAVAPIIGMARLTSSLPHLLEALDIELVDD